MSEDESTVTRSIEQQSGRRRPVAGPARATPSRNSTRRRRAASQIGGIRQPRGYAFDKSMQCWEDLHAKFPSAAIVLEGSSTIARCRGKLCLNYGFTALPARGRSARCG
jgi:hypothetical protein